eukprot:270938-Hanusia_phi.AAC.1
MDLNQHVHHDLRTCVTKPSYYGSGTIPSSGSDSSLTVISTPGLPGHRRSRRAAAGARRSCRRAA